MEGGRQVGCGDRWVGEGQSSFHPPALDRGPSMARWIKEAASDTFPGCAPLRIYPISAPLPTLIRGAVPC